MPLHFSLPVIKDRIVTLHRGSVIDKVMPSHATRLRREHPWAVEARTSPPSRLPRISVDRLTDANRLATPRLAKGAIDELGRPKSCAAVKAVVRSHIDTQFADESPEATGEMPEVVLIGEDHPSATAFEVEMAALGHLLEKGHSPTLMVELSRTDHASMFGQELDDMARHMQNGTAAGAESRRADPSHGRADVLTPPSLGRPPAPRSSALSK